tara:strand:- start:730 stop:1875 length:1146 start_codon:yes stop_codon:yes gene_type:complete
MDAVEIPEESKVYYEKLNNYYELKSEYEKVNNNKKNKIKKKYKDQFGVLTISIPELRSKIDKIKPICIHCGQEGGTLFKQEDKILYARCLCNTPCDLNIQIKLPKNHYLPKFIQTYEKSSNELKKNIIVTKLNYIFDLEKDDITSQKFNVLKKDYVDQDKILNLLKKKLEDQLYTTEYDYDNFMLRFNDSQNSGEQKTDPEKKYSFRKDIIIEKTKVLNEHISDIKDIIKKHEKEPARFSLTEAVQIYIKNVIPLQEYIRSIKYNISYIDIVGEERRIKQIKNYISNFIFENEPGEILENNVQKVVKKKKKKKPRKKKLKPTVLPEKDDTPPQSESKKDLPVKDESPKDSDKETEETEETEETKNLSDLDELEEFEPTVDS